LPHPKRDAPPSPIKQKATHSFGSATDTAQTVARVADHVRAGVKVEALIVRKLGRSAAWGWQPFGLVSWLHPSHLSGRHVNDRTALGAEDMNILPELVYVGLACCRVRRNITLPIKDDAWFARLVTQRIGAARYEPVMFVGKTAVYPLASRGTAAIYRRSTLMSERTKRCMLRRIISDRLYEFHRGLIVQFSSDAENFLERVRLSSMRCPACGGQMALSRTIATYGPREAEHVFACVGCGLSYLTEDHIPVNGHSVI
jgi:hypothetical protein